MEDSVKRILSESVTIISRLQLLSVFFEEDLIYRIFIRSQVIQKLFENNPELDVNKLELFHLQYTESIIDLLRKIKKTNEKNLTLLSDEIELNNELITKISTSIQDERNFYQEAQKHTIEVNQSLSNLYQNLSDYSSDDPFSKNIKFFSTQLSKSFFHPVSDGFIYGLMEYEPEHMYKNGYAAIEKRLMGLQCKHDFKNTFYCGLISGNLVVEIYKLIGEDVYFLFYPDKKLFVDFPFAKISTIQLSDELSRKNKIIKELEERNDSLKNSETSVKTNLPADVAALLVAYNEKISSIDFIDFIDDYDVQANILKTMLNTDRI